MEDKFIKILEAILLMRDKLTQFDIMTKLDMSIREIIFVEKIYNEIVTFK